MAIEILFPNEKFIKKHCMYKKIDMKNAFCSNCASWCTPVVWKWERILTLDLCSYMDSWKDLLINFM